MIRAKINNLFLGTLVFSSGVITICSSAFADTTNSPDKPVPSLYLAQSTIDTASIEASVVEQINQFRNSLALPALTRNSAMDNQARMHSQNMANDQIPFGHYGFSQRIQASSIPYQEAAENVATNFGYSDPATQAVQGWLISSGHLNNIRGEYDLTGVGVATNSKGEVYLTQIFLRSPSQPITTNSPTTTSQPITTSSPTTTSQPITTSSSQATTSQTSTTSTPTTTSQTSTTSTPQATTSQTSTTSTPQVTTSQPITTSSSQATTSQTSTTSTPQVTTSQTSTTSTPQVTTSQTSTTSSSQVTTSQTSTTSTPQATTSQTITTSTPTTTSQTITTSTPQTKTYTIDPVSIELFELE